MLSRAYARAARSGFASIRFSKSSRLVCRFQYTYSVAVGCGFAQKKATWLVAGVRGKFFTSASSRVISGESKAGGGPGRTWLLEVRAQVFQVPASGSRGFVPVHR